MMRWSEVKRKEGKGTKGGVEELQKAFF